ncbi:vitellogenin-3-like [Varroa destructor]|uniref:Vitellogenin n=1 Tax=Varroa destructor TaxID=109461 RepID=A0A7M7MFD5_VARDE|nr:vitellogenin-3-like [Varroa destructor]
MKVLFAIALLAAAASAEVFQFVGQRGYNTTVYSVRGGVTVGSQELTDTKTALEYNGTFVIEKIGQGQYLAQFTQFALSKYDQIDRRIQDETFNDLKPEEQHLAKVLHVGQAYEPEMQKPIRFSMEKGRVTRMEAGQNHRQWSLNIYRAVLTLLQNQVKKPVNQAVPFVEYKYEDGITGNCKVQYEIFSQPKDGTIQDVYNMTKTNNYKQCLGRPVYLHLKDIHRGCAGVCDNHRPENFLSQYEEETTDFEMKPTPGCPVNQQHKDSLVSFQTVAKYNFSKGFLDEARSESIDVFRLFGGRMQVFSRLQLRFRDVQGPKIEQLSDVKIYETLQQRLPKQEEDELDIPVFALMKKHTLYHRYPLYFQQQFENVIRDLHKLQGNQKHDQNEQQGFDAPAYLAELIQAISGMTEEEIKKTMPSVVRSQQPNQLSEENKLQRQVWVELLGKAGSKSAVKVAIELIKGKTFTSSEVRRILQDVAAFQSYPDIDMIEQVLGLCLQSQGLSATVKATACVAAGKIISKGCNSKVHQKVQKKPQYRQQLVNGKYDSIYHDGDQQGENQEEPDSETEGYETTMGHLAIKPKLRCTSDKLQEYIQRLTQTLNQATGFKNIVALINGLAKVEKPEILPELVPYVEGTAPNMQQAHEQGENQKESVEFLRRVAILSLRNIAVKYPKEINPIVRVIYLNTTEQVQTRLNAFDVWMNTQPAQWEVDRVMQVANRDSSVELTYYVYNTFKTAMQAKEPCYQLLAHRIRTAWAQMRSFDLGMILSHVSSKFYYNTAEGYGIRGIWKMIASNTTVLPAFSHVKLEQVRGPFMRALFGAKLLVKGGNKIWEELVGRDGLLERMSQAVNGQVNNGPRQRSTEQLIKYIAQGINNQDIGNETPKAVLFWKLFAGEAIVPIDEQYASELKAELLQSINNVGKEGVSGHFIRVLVPTKAFFVEPNPIGFPIVHSTIHPLVISVRYRNLKLHYRNQEGHLIPKAIGVSGTIQPVILSFRQSRVFVAEEEPQLAPTMKITDVKEFNVKVNFDVHYDQAEQRFRASVKPQFGRVFHTAFCPELKLAANTIVSKKPSNSLVNYTNCVKTRQQLIQHDLKVGDHQTGMVIRLTGESRQVWSALGILGSVEFRREGFLGAIINSLNMGMHHHAISLYLEADKQQPVNEWTVVIDMDSNLEQLAKQPVNQQTEKVQKPKLQCQLCSKERLYYEFQQVMRKVREMLQKSQDNIGEVTVEKQMLIKIEGRYQGQPKRTFKVATKKIHNFEQTKQYYALAVEHQGSNKSIELFANLYYPTIRSPFHYDPTYSSEDERMNGSLVANIQGWQEGQVYFVNFQAMKSNEQKQKSEYEWFEIHCLAEQEASRAMTDSCKRATFKDNLLDSMEIRIELPQNVHPKAQNLAFKMLDMVKYILYPKMQIQMPSTEERRHQQTFWGEKKEVLIFANAIRESPWSFLYNVRIVMPFQNVVFSQIRLPGLRFFHTQLTDRQQLEHGLFRGQHNNRCVLGDKYLRTYDNVTFSLDVKEGCDYLLTHDQSAGDPDFTVTFEVVKPHTFGRKIRAQLQNYLVEFFPFTTTDRQFQVTINGQQHYLTFEKPIVFSYGRQCKRAAIHAYETSNSHHAPVISLFTESKEFGVIFDGESVQVHVDDKYKGATNGICGNNDDEQDHEFIGPHGHEYEHSNEFIASYSISQQCKAPVLNTYKQQMEALERALRKIRQPEWQMKEQRCKDMQTSQHQQQQHTQNQFSQHWNKIVEEQMFLAVTPEEHQQWGGKISSQGRIKVMDQDNHPALETFASSHNGRGYFFTRKSGYTEPIYATGNNETNM